MLVRISNNIYYLCSFSQGGRGAETTVLLVSTFLTVGRGTEALVLLVWVLYFATIVSSSVCI